MTTIFTPAIIECKKGCGQPIEELEHNIEEPLKSKMCYCGNEYKKKLNLCPTCQSILSTLLKCEKMHENWKREFIDKLKKEIEEGYFEQRTLLKFIENLAGQEER